MQLFLEIKVFGIDNTVIRIIFAEIALMINEKRSPKAYKIKDSIYEKAKKKSNKPLATFVEDFVTAISEDDEIIIKGVVVHPINKKVNK